MKSRNILLISLCICIQLLCNDCSWQVRGTTIYVSSSMGSDSNDGLSPNRPLKSIKCGLSRGDVILLKSGDVFYESLNVVSKKISNYGEGNMPIISGWRVIRHPVWSSLGNNIWVLCLTDSTIFSGFKVVGSSFQNNLGCIFDIQNNEVHGRRMQYLNELHEDWDFWQTEKHKRSELIPKDFDSLYLYLNNDPNTLNLAVSVSSVAMTVSNCEIENVQIEGWGFGISAGCKTIIRNCKIDAIGGRLAFAENEFVSYGNGIEFYISSNTKDCLVENNHISRCYDCGVTIQGSGHGQATPRNIIVRNNVIERCCQAWEDFLRNDDNVVYDNCVFERNVVLNSGNTSGYGYFPSRFKYCHILGNNFQGNRGMIIRNNTFVGGNYYCSGAYNDLYKSNNWQQNTCIIKRGDYLLGNYTGSKDVIRVPIEKGEFSSIKAATDDAIKKYRALTGDETTKFVIRSESTIRRRANELLKHTNKK